MKNFKKNVNGITLIALAIAIVVMLILSGVAIATLTGKSGILRMALQTTEDMEYAMEIERVKIAVTNASMKGTGRLSTEKIKNTLEKEFGTDKVTGDTFTGNGPWTFKGEKENYEIGITGSVTKKEPSKSVTEIQQAKELVNENTEVETDDNVRVVIPAGFAISDESPTNAKQGIIITDSIDETTGKSNGNEFVWIPIDNNLNVHGTDKPMAKVSTNEEYKGTNGKVNYEGVLYDFTGTESTEMSSSYGQGTWLWREPDALYHYDYDEEHLSHMQSILKEEANKYANKETFKATMQEDYDEMINSVIKYGGFFVARYEMGIENGKAISKVGTATDNGNYDNLSHQWFGLYAYAKTFTNTKNSVKSSMIWGSQYDAMLNYALTGSDKYKVTAKGNSNHGENAIDTGRTPTDKILNIFDLEGNYGEWTLEAYNDNRRTPRGGCFNNNYSPNFRRDDRTPDSTDRTLSTRFTLYIK